MTMLDAATVKDILARNGLTSPAQIELLDPRRAGGLDLGEHAEAVHAYRRLANLGADLSLAQRMQERGIHCANQVALMTEDFFLREHAAPLGLDRPEALRMHRRAVEIRNRTLHLFATVHGSVASPHGRALRVSSVADEVRKRFESLPSYQDLFGSLDFCACDHCASILGPAAYFVDLMRLVDKYVTAENPGIDPELLLSARRPDLWALPLTCANTSDTVPYLQIVNERLSAAAAGLYPDAAPNLLQRVATTFVHPVALPFNAPLDRIRVLLVHLGVPLHEVYAAWGANPQQVALEGLGLTPERTAILTTAATDPATIAAYYGVAPEEIGTLADLAIFAGQAGLGIPEAEALIVQGLSGEEIQLGVAKSLFVNGRLNGAFLQLKTDQEKTTIENLDPVALDDLQRILRLAATLGWKPADADWAIRALAPQAAPALDDATLPVLAFLARSAQALGLTPAQAACLLGPIKTYGDEGLGLSLFDALFNAEEAAQGQAPYRPAGNPLNPGYQDPPLAWTPGQGAGSPQLLRVAPGLGLDLGSLDALGLALFGQGQTLLTVANLSILYRHALLQRATDLDMDAYLRLLSLAGLRGALAPTPDQIDALLGLRAWMAGAGLDVYQLDYVATGARSVYVNPLLDEAQVEGWHAGLVASLPADGADPLAAVQAQTALLLGIDATLAAPALALAVEGTTPPTQDGTWLEAFLAQTPEGKPLYPAYVLAILDLTARWAVFSRATGVSPLVLGGVASNPGPFGLAPRAPPTVDALRGIQSLAALMQRFGDVRGGLLRYVALSAAAGAPPAPPPPDALAALQAATGWDPLQAASILQNELKDQTDAPLRLQALDACFRQISALGANAALLRKLRALADVNATNGWDALVAASRQLQDVCMDRYGSGWAAASGGIEGDLNVRLRDALAGIVLDGLQARFEGMDSLDAVSQYLLLDVQTGPEAQISYVKEALNAVQLYLQRCRLRLEPKVDKLAIPPAWWDWGLDYRIWEASRRIFLYPENYLVPSARADKTSLFRALESELQQSDVTDAHVEQAYAAYIEGLLSLADLEPIEAFHGRIEDERLGEVDATYLFARTRTQPATFYWCRKVQDDPWSEWQKIDIGINASHVTPVWAFNKLLLFWVQIDRVDAPSVQTGASGAIQTSANGVWRASVRCSFQNRAGAWVQPQTLVQDELLYYGGQDPELVTLLANDIFAGVFDPAHPAWGRVAAFRLGPANASPGLMQDQERVVLLHGPFLAASSTWATIPDTPPQGAEARAFFDKLAQAARGHNLLLAAQTSGSLTYGPAYVLDESLDGSFLVRNAEIVLLDPSVTEGGAWPRFVLNEREGTLQLAASATPASDDTMASPTTLLDPPSTPRPVTLPDLILPGIPIATAATVRTGLSFRGVLDAQGNVVPEALQAGIYAALCGPPAAAVGPVLVPEVQRVLLEHLGAPALLSALPPDQARLETVKGLMGACLLRVGEESFLFSLTPPPGEPSGVMQDSLVLRLPPVNPGSFVCNNPNVVIDLTLSGQIFQALAASPILDAQGIPQPPQVAAQLSQVLAPLGLSADQAAVVLHELMAYPQVGTYTFQPVLGADKATAIVDTLRTFSLLDANARLAIELLNGASLTAALGNLVLQGTLSRGDVTQAYRALLAAPSLVSLGCRPGALPSAFLGTSVFAATRLTTAAVPRLERALLLGGIERLLSLQSQDVPLKPVLPFNRLGPQPGRIIPPKASDGAQVDFDGLYGRYFWELFLHGPLLVADALASNQRHRESIVWLQRVFDPTTQERFIEPGTLAAELPDVTPDASQKAFALLVATIPPGLDKPALLPLPHDANKARVNPDLASTTDLGFLTPTLLPETVPMVVNLLLNAQLLTPQSRFWNFRPFRTLGLTQLRETLEDDGPNVRAYNLHPFDPFAIARVRLDAFEKAALMQYVDVLIRWGDAYFAQDTWESITAASMLYGYASDLLGPRPRQVGACSAQPPATFAQIQTKYGPTGIPQFLIDLETLLPEPRLEPDAPIPAEAHAFNDLGTLFCVPENDRLVSYWDRVEDRLSKIRHSQDIQGRTRALALFQPPLDPMALVRAAAGSGGYVPAQPSPRLPPPQKRFRALLDRAKALASAVSDLGAQILSVLEKKDAEGLALLSATQQNQVLALTTEVRQQQVTDAQETLASLQAALESAQARLAFYAGLVQQGLSDPERTNLDAMATALGFTVAATTFRAAATITYAIPQVGSPFAMTYGGIQLGNVATAAAGVAEIGSDVSSYVAQRSLTMAGYGRRLEEWVQQQTQARLDVASLQRQVASAQARLAAARQDLAIQRVSVSQGQAVEAFLQGKFTNEDLYQWMLGRLAGTYFQTYQLALEASRAAQAAYQFERSTSATFLDLDFWDGLRQGLLAGAGLTFALQRMDASYDKAGPRRLEVERTISLGQLDPAALYLLRTRGECSFTLPEALFDYDYPGLYSRKIKTLSISIPAVVGPYENVKATLTQTKNALATQPDVAAVRYLLSGGTRPPSVLEDVAVDQQIAISRGMDDNGRFVLDFQDDQYAPFEGTGAVSSWTLRMPQQTNRFDLAQVSDVILTLSYTALSGGDALRQAVEKELAQPANWLTAGYFRDFRQQDPLAWSAFLEDRANPDVQTLAFRFEPTGLVGALALKIQALLAMLEVSSEVAWPAEAATIAAVQISGADVGALVVGGGAPPRVELSAQPTPLAGDWRLAFRLDVLRERVPTLLKDGWIDPQRLRDVSWITLLRARMF